MKVERYSLPGFRYADSGPRPADFSNGRRWVRGPKMRGAHNSEVVRKGRLHHMRTMLRRGMHG